MDNQQVAALIGVDAVELSRKCGLGRGCFYMWILREVIMKQYLNMQPPEQECLKKAITHAFSLKNSYVYGINEAFINGDLEFKFETINRAVIVNCHNNPFGIKL